MHVFGKRYLLSGDDVYEILDLIGLPCIDMVEINREYTSISYMTNYDIHILKMYKEKLGEDGSKGIHWNWCIFCYIHGNCMLYRFYCDVCR